MQRTLLRLVIFASILTSHFTTGCRSTTANEADTALTSIGSPLKLCVALRGNGHYVSSHFGALAGILEQYGSIDSLAGGSSSTVTMFLYESMILNPAIQDATDEERPLKIALLMKSLMGYFEALKTTPEVSSVFAGLAFYQDAKLKGLANLPKSEWQATGGKLYSTLSQSNAFDLVNQNILDMLQAKDTLGYANTEYRTQEAIAAAKVFGKFTANQQSIFFREGVLNFKAFAEYVGYVGDFYAGRDPVSQEILTKFINQCGSTEITSGKTWKDIQTNKIGFTGSETCGQLLSDAIQSYFKSITKKTPLAQSRVDEVMGARVPVIASTAVIENEQSVNTMRQSKKNYLAKKPLNLNIPFEDVKFGYWPYFAYRKRIEKGIAKFSDEKSRKYVTIDHNPTWRTVLESSPAEPGLSSYVELPGNKISIGGWSDLAPVQVLKAAGCDNVIYVTRRGAESDFIAGNTPMDGRAPLGVAELVGMKEPTRKAIYDLANPTSGFSTALTTAGAVWCTDWNRFTDGQTEEMMNEAYCSDVVANNEYFKTAGRSGCAKQVTEKIVGCN